MGIIWRSAMPLMTTLAALVIIVHSAEEDLETEYRHDLRPRILDTGSPTYDQPWRTMEAEHPVQQIRHIENWDNESPDELPKHRRTGRKRKRRPQTGSTEDIEPQERFVYPEEPPRPYHDVDSEITYQTTEMPKRRRKKTEIRPIRWTDDVVDIERPMRKRAQRRKRPLLDTWSELTEFRLSPAAIQREEEAKTEPIDQVGIDDMREESLQEVVTAYKNEPELTEKRFTHQHPTNEIPLPIDDGEDVFEHRRDEIIENKSLSEFSSEVMMNVPRPTKQSNIQLINNHHNLSDGTFKEFDKAQDNNLMDPLTLKDILKRSNGTSLSEILQQHNLSLTDLLHGKHHAVSIFKSQDSQEVQNRNPSEPRNDLSEIRPDVRDKEEPEERKLINLESKFATGPATEYPLADEIQTEVNQKDENEPTTTVKPLEEKTLKISTRRRFPQGTRKKLRMRPMLNNTYKGQLSRDLITLNARRYSHHRRNITKSKEWRTIPSIMQNNTHVEEKNISVEYITTTIAAAPEETTMTIEFANNNNEFEEINLEDSLNSKIDDINIESTETTTFPTKEIPTEIPKPATEKPSVISMARPTVNSSGLRRQAFNNRLKKKRLKQKNSTIEPPQDDLIKHLFGMGNLVSSSEFIARTQEPKSIDDENQNETTLDDFMTTESTRRTESGIVQTKTSTTKVSTTPPSIIPSTTEEISKIEIEEILNDTRASAKLSKILMERNMTLGELVEHRERGSSHVHLADIFHNASREPNPPEPFLSKSLLEPISKETYPLRALLDANSHDPNARATTVDSNIINNVNIPIVMDYRNNVNEHAENMGIMSLFNNFTKPENKSTSVKDSEERTRQSPIVVDKNTNMNNSRETVREGRILNESQDDVVSWNEIFSLMGRGHSNDTSSNKLEGLSLSPLKKIRLDEDVDGDGLIVFEDLQHLKDFESNIGSVSDEKVEVNAFENKESPQQGSGILDKIPSQTKSVTVATASIAGLAMILFLLTYAAFKWKQQRSVIRKKRSFGDERIPTPVFENRKGHKNNSSTRSVSPMLQTSNIYTLNTLDSQNGTDSPDYMWETLRKPFQ